MGTTPHVMDEIPVRQLRFKFDEDTHRNPVWSQSWPEFSMLINALGVQYPISNAFL